MKEQVLRTRELNPIVMNHHRDVPDQSLSRCLWVFEGPKDRVFSRCVPPLVV